MGERGQEKRSHRAQFLFSLPLREVVSKTMRNCEHSDGRWELGGFEFGASGDFLENFSGEFNLESIWAPPKLDVEKWVVSGGKVFSDGKVIVDSFGKLISGTLDDVIKLSANGIAQVTGIAGLAVPGIGTAVATVASGLFSFFDSLFDSPPPPPSYEGEEWEKVVGHIRAGRIVSSRMAEVFGLAVNGSAKSKDVVDKSARSAASAIWTTVWRDSLRKLKVNDLSEKQTRYLSLFAAAAGPKKLAEQTLDKRDLVHISKLVALGSQRAMLRRAIESAFLWEVRKRIREGVIPFPYRWGEYPVETSFTKGSTYIKTNQLGRGTLGEWSLNTAISLFPGIGGNEGRSSPFVTPEFVKQEIAYYNKTDEEETFYQRFSTIGTVKFTVTNMEKAIRVAFLVAGREKNYMRDWKNDLADWKVVHESDLQEKSAKRAGDAPAAEMAKREKERAKKRKEKTLWESSYYKEKDRAKRIKTAVMWGGGALVGGLLLKSVLDR